MKCKTCGYEIPSGKNYCPGCGRVLSKIEQEQTTAKDPVNIFDNTEFSPSYRRPATADTSAMSENIKAIFSADADAPAYHDPHTYKSATAHVLEYDRNFVQRKTPAENTQRINTQPVSRNNESANDYNDDTAETRRFTPIRNDYNNPVYDDDETEDNEDYTEKKRGSFKINPTYLLICIIVVAGLAIIGLGGYNVGKQLGLWGDTEKTSGTHAEKEDDDKKEPTDDKAPVVNVPEINPDVDNVADYKIGTYTINAADNNILLYKNSSLDQIIATIPNLSVVEITEIKEESGKCSYGSYTGWLDMKLLMYTPDAKLPEVTTEVKTTEAETTTSEITTDPETTTSPVTEPSYSTGTYTVDLQNDGYMLNVRSEASIDADVVTTISDGTVVEVSRIEGDWGHISTTDGYTGWVYMIYLK